MLGSLEKLERNRSIASHDSDDREAHFDSFEPSNGAETIRAILTREIRGQEESAFSITTRSNIFHERLELIAVIIRSRLNRLIFTPRTKLIVSMISHCFRKCKAKFNSCRQALIRLDNQWDSILNNPLLRPESVSNTDHRSTSSGCSL